MKYGNGYHTNRAHVSPSTKFDAVERRFVRLFDAISYAHPIIKFRLWIAGKRDDTVVTPAPRAVIDAIVSKALDGLVDWGGATGIQCPACFEVQVPVSAWRMYYGHGTTEICKRIESAVQTKLHRKLGCDLSPRVSICPTTALFDGELIVQASYFGMSNKQADAQEVELQRGYRADACDAEASDTATTIRLDGRTPVDVVDGMRDVHDTAEDTVAAVEGAYDVETGVKGRVESDATRVIDAASLTDNASASGDAPAAEQDVFEVPALTPNLATAESAGTLAFGRKRYSVRDGMTVGIKRGDGPDQADIMLPYSGDFYLVSRRHGRFVYDVAQGVWRFEQLGSNGTTVVRDGQIVTTLKRGDSVALRDGDGLLLADARQQVSFLLASENRTICLGAA